MAFEQFKTQVLLLHSEQSKLDELSSGFNDRYTVHCATSGAEALTTLGEIPIHVIVSANNLPGMSGIEALREAKKRSPETIGILLAGDDKRPDEALVGEKEIFQVVRGDVDPQSITKLIESATQQMRLMTLASSANDNAAEPDEGTGEHIVMETDDHGSTIVSDGTGTHAVLDPGKLAETTPVGAHAVGLLVMSKDEQFLASIKECSRGLHTVHSASSIKQAQELIKEGKVGVSIIDAGLVGPNVEKLAQHLQAIEKRLVTIVAGRRDDGDMLMDLINRGKVYRFLLKPVSAGRVRLAVDASIKHHLDSPDSAFQKAGTPDATPAPDAKAAPNPPARPAARQPEAKQRKAASTPAPAVSPDESAITEGLSTAFGDDDSRFAETVSGIVSRFGRSREEAETADTALGHAMPDSGGDDSAFRRKAMIGGAAIVVIAAVAIGLWMSGGADDEAPGDSAPVASTATENADTPPAEPASTSQAAGNVPDTATDSNPPTDASTREPAVASGSETVAAPGGASVAATTATDDSVAALVAEAEAAIAAGQIFTPASANALELYSEALVLAPENAEVASAFDATINRSISIIETALLEANIGVAEKGIEQVTLAQPDHPRLPFLIAQAGQTRLRLAIDGTRDAIREGDFETAAARIDDAAANGADSSTLESLNDELASARSSQETEQVLSVAARRLEQGRLLTPARDNARYLYDLVLRNDPDNAAARQGLSAVAAKLVLNARIEMDANRLDQAQSLLASAADIDAASPELAAARQALEDMRGDAERRAARQAEQDRLEAERQAAAASAAEAEAARPVPVSSLTRVKYVAPKYPRSAERREISGWVDVVFTVSLDGSVRDVEVLDSDPGDTFVSSAVSAVERWEFEPVREDGGIVEKRAGVRLMFAIE